MLGQTVARILVVTTLIVTAHAIKPFSVKNITSHFLYSSRSLAFILPDSARSGFDHANKLALTLSNSLFSNEGTSLLWTKRSDANSNRFAMNTKPMADITADFSSRESVTIKAARPSKKRGVNAVATEETGPIDMTGSFIAAEADDNFTTAPMPTALPLLRLNLECALLKNIQPISVEMFHIRTPRTIYEPKRSGCDKFNGKQTKLIAFVERKKERLRFDWVKVERSIFTSMECKEEGAESMKEAEYAAESQKRAIMRQEAGAMAIPELQHNRDNCSNP